MRDETQRKADARLARIEGQIRAVRKMVTEDRYCIDVVRQVQAARSALRCVCRALNQIRIFLVGVLGVIRNSLLSAIWNPSRIRIRIRIFLDLDPAACESERNHSKEYTQPRLQTSQNAT